MQQTLLDIDLGTLNLKHPPLFNKDDHGKYVNDWRGPVSYTHLTLPTTVQV